MEQNPKETILTEQIERFVQHIEFARLSIFQSNNFQKKRGEETILMERPFGDYEETLDNNGTLRLRAFHTGVSAENQLTKAIINPDSMTFQAQFMNSTLYDDILLLQAEEERNKYRSHQTLNVITWEINNMIHLLGGGLITLDGARRANPTSFEIDFQNTVNLDEFLLLLEADPNNTLATLFENYLGDGKPFLQKEDIIWKNRYDKSQHVLKEWKIKKVHVKKTTQEEVESWIKKLRLRLDESS